MIRKPLMTAGLPMVAVLLVVGCAGHSTTHPEGMEDLRWLTDAEKDRVIEIALNSPKALEMKNDHSQYEVELEWIGVTW